MRTLLLLLAVSVLVVVNCRGQEVSIWNLTAMRADSPIMLRYASNKVQIISKDVPVTQINVRVMDSLGRPVEKFRQRSEADTLSFDISPERGDVEVLVEHGSRAIYRKRYHTVQPPYPVAQLGWLRGPTASKAEVLAQPDLVVSDPTGLFRYAKSIRVTSYVFRANSADGPVEIQVLGGQITQEIQQVISALRRGSKIDFAEIRIVGADMCPTRIADIQLTVH